MQLKLFVLPIKNLGSSEAEMNRAASKKQILINKSAINTATAILLQPYENCPLSVVAPGRIKLLPRPGRPIHDHHHPGRWTGLDQHHLAAGRRELGGLDGATT